MGEPGESNISSSVFNGGKTGRTEPSKYPKEEKPNRNSLSSGERNGMSPNFMDVIAGMRYS